MNIKRKAYTFFLLLFTLFCFVGCFDTEQEGTEDENIVFLTLENYTYYLTIDRSVQGSGSYAGGNFTYVNMAVTISGAVDGEYRNCKLYYRFGEGEQREICLNAAGYARFSYTVTNSTGAFAFVGAEGSIVFA